MSTISRFGRRSPCAKFRACAHFRILALFSLPSPWMVLETLWHLSDMPIVSYRPIFSDHNNVIPAYSVAFLAHVTLGCLHSMHPLGSSLNALCLCTYPQHFMSHFLSQHGMPRPVKIKWWIMVRGHWQWETQHWQCPSYIHSEYLVGIEHDFSGRLHYMQP